MTCDEEEHQTICDLQFLRWWGAGNEVDNNNNSATQKQEDVMMASCGKCCKVGVKEGDRITVGNVNKNKKVQHGKQILLQQEFKQPDGIIEEECVVGKGKELDTEEQKNEHTKDDGHNIRDNDQIKEEGQIGGKESNGVDAQEYHSDGEEGDEMGFLVMADCVQHESGGAPAKVWSKTGSEQKSGSNKIVSKVIKSVIDIDDDESNRTGFRFQEDSNLLINIKTVRVKKVVRVNCATKKRSPPVSNKKEMEPESPGSLNLVSNLTGSSSNQTRKEELRNSTTVELFMNRFEAGGLIGHQGSNINKLERGTGARIKVSKDGEMRTVKIHGNAASVAKAKAAVEKYLFSNCTTKVKVSNSVARALYRNKGKLLRDIKVDCNVEITGQKEGADDILYVFGSEEAESKAEARLEEFCNSMMQKK